MKFAYKFSNLLGTVYRQGDLKFTPDGYSVISPVGNRITIFDLKNNKSSTLAIESRFNYVSLDLSPNGNALVAVNEDGEAYFISLISRTVVHKYHFKRPVPAIKFSPDGKHFAACKENNVFIFKAPGPYSGEVNAFAMERVFHGSFDATTCIEWAQNSEILAVGSKDMSTRIYSLKKYKNFRPFSLGSHTDIIVACFFEENSLDLITISRNGQVCMWDCNIKLSSLVPFEEDASIKKARVDEEDVEDDGPEESIEKSQSKETNSMNNQEKITEFVEDETVQERDDQGKIILKTDDQKHSFFYRRHSRHYLADEVRKEDKNAVLTAATYHKKTKILVTGFSNGSFFLHEMPEVNMIHSLSISQQNITALSINNTGDWIALGCSGVGQLLVWEWQCEQYVMKQQGHSSNMTCLSYSPDSEFIVTGGLDGKLKLWNTSTGFCVITFSEHTSAITQVQFSKKCFISSSLDGTVRAFDMTRYRNFRTFTSPSRPVQFSCVAVDSSGELVCAGGQDIFELYLWSMKMGRLLEVLSGHEGPVVSISFSPSPGSSCLVSCSWDGTIRVWNALESSAQNEPIILGSDALCVTFRPDGEEIAVATLDGQITMFHVKSGSQTHSIEGRNDLGSGRTETDLVTAKQSLKGKAFTSLCYSADGECILAGGQSKNVCIYNVQEGILLKKFQITQNRSFDAVDDFINRRKMTEFGNIALIEEREISEGGNVTIKLPGVKSGDMASRSVKPEVRVLCLQFSPAGHSWAACTTEGLLLYSLDNAFVFDPFLLDLGTTPEAARNCLKEQQYSMALIMALRLNELALIHEIIEQIPYADIEITANSLPQEYAKRALKFISKTLEGTTHIQFYLRWTTAFLEMLGPRDRGTILPETLVALEKSLLRKYDALSKICDFNKYTLQWVKKMGELEEAKQTQVINDDDSNEDEMDYSDHDDSETEITDLLSVKL